jgi:putative ABC transport system permease protein
MSGLWWMDVRRAVRGLAATPAFTAIGLAVLSLGLGASTAMFSVADATALRGLPFDRSSRLIAIADAGPDGFVEGVTPPDFLDWRDRQDVFAGLAASGYGGLSLKRVGDAPPEILEGLRVTNQFFETLRVRPVLGRTFDATSETAAGSGVVLISYSLWQRRFGGRSGVLGAVLPGQRRDFEIIGVMPAGFTYPAGAIVPTDVWMPVVFAPEDRVRGSDISHSLAVIGRLKDGVDIAAARGEIAGVTQALAAASPRWFEGRRVVIEPLHAFLTRGVHSWMVMLLGAVSCVLLIAGVNAANLLIARATAREHELGVRAALGGSSWDLARVLLAESLVLSLTGAVVGLALGWAAIRLLESSLPTELPGLANVAVDARVVLAVLTAAFVIGVTCGLAPMLSVGRGSRATLLSQSGRTRTASVRQGRLRSAFIAIEVGLAVMLLVGAGLFLTSFARVSDVDLGLDYHHVLTLRVRPLDLPRTPDERAQLSAAHRVAFQSMLAASRAIPGVEEAAIVESGLPLRGDLVTVDVQVAGRVLPPNMDVEATHVSPAYFHLLRIPLRRGRGFGDDDRVGSTPVVILNETAARAFFADSDPVGKTIGLGGHPFAVVGVVGDIHRDGPEVPPNRQAYLPFGQGQVGGATIVVRTMREETAMTAPLERAAWNEFPNVPLTGVVALESYLTAMLAPRRLNMLLLGLFGGLGLAIATIGIYAVTAFVVMQRTREIGIRLALGAQRSAVLRTVIGSSLRPIALGLMAGLAAAWLSATVLQRFLFAVSPHAALVYVIAAAISLSAGIAAASGPARRAALIDPLTSLRTE